MPERDISSDIEAAKKRLREQMKETGGERTLTPGDVEAIAEAVAPKLAALVGQPSPTFAFVDARELAGELGVSTAYVYEHSAELGAMKLGTGPKARMRFDLDQARQALEARRRRPPQRGRRARG